MSPFPSAFIIGGSVASFSVGESLVGVTLLIPGLIWTWWSFEKGLKKWSVIHLRKRADLPSFWKRNKDRIIVAIIVAIGSSLITLFFTNLSKILRLLGLLKNLEDGRRCLRFVVQNN